MYQDGTPGDDGAGRKAPGGPVTNIAKTGFIFWPTTVVGTCRHNRRHGDGCCGSTLGREQAGRDGLSKFTAFATAVWGGKWRAEADCRQLHGVAEQWADPMGRI